MISSQLCSLVLLGAETCKAVRDVQLQLVRTLDDLFALLGTYVVCNFNRVLLIVHQQHLQVGRALNEKLIKSVLEAKACLLTGAISNAWHKSASVELSANSA